MQRDRGKYRFNGIDLLHKLADLPQEAVQWLKAKAQTAVQEKKLLGSAHEINMSENSLKLLRKRLRWMTQLSGAAGGSYGGGGAHGAGGHGGGGHGVAAGAGAGSKPPAADLELLEQIRRQRDVHNLNNVTRTAAYLNLYREHPELHWAMLAHMVSRNGGWCMTDLRGDLLPLLLSEEQLQHLFAFLERCNALIFWDAYPQLLLYRASLRARRPLFHLLPQLGVSRFMRPLWDCFWELRDSAMLTVGLIVNEQNYIESRVVRHPEYRRHVLDTVLFQTQSLLQLNQVVFPYAHGDRVRLAGLIVENFSSLQERIEVGKKLYAVLFGIPAVYDGALHFACAKRHSGSRADYWPHLFAAVRREPPAPGGQLKERLDGCKLRDGAAHFYSPKLTDCWKDRPVAPPEPGDWFQGPEVMEYFTDIRAPFSFEMTHEYCFGLNKIEMAVLAGDLLV